MSKREKIILFLALGVALYGLLDFLVLSGDSGKSGQDAADKVRNTSEFSAAAMARISKIELQGANSNWEAWTVRIESEWDPDPFVRNNEFDKKATDTGLSADAGLFFTGYMLVGKKAFAVINGMEYKTGETVSPQGFMVKKITARKVVLQRNSEHVVLYLKEKQL